MSTQMLKVTTETEINDVRRVKLAEFHVNATVFKNPLNCIGYISFMQAWFYRGNGNDCTLIASP